MIKSILKKIKNLLIKLHPYNNEIDKQLEIINKELKLQEEYKKTHYSKKTELDVNFDNIKKIDSGDLATKIELL